MKFKDLKQRLTEAAENPAVAQQKKPPADDMRAKVMAAKSVLGLKDLNVAAAVAGHKMFQAHAAKNPKLNTSQILNKISPNAREQLLKLVRSGVPLNAPLKQLRPSLQRLKQIQAGNDNLLSNSYEVTDKEQITESLQDEINPPPMLVLRRKGIRIFPDGRRVALFTNDKLGLVFTIPYNVNAPGSPGVIPGVQSEETETEDLLENLDQVAKYAQQDNVTSHAKHFKFADGSKLKVSHGAAKAIHMVHGALNAENKKKFADMLTTPKGFEKAAHFALSKVNFTIGGK
jgi:hypothetical protein